MYCRRPFERGLDTGYRGLSPGCVIWSGSHRLIAGHRATGRRPEGRGRRATHRQRAAGGVAVRNEGRHDAALGRTTDRRARRERPLHGVCRRDIAGRLAEGTFRDHERGEHRPLARRRGARRDRTAARHAAERPSAVKAGDADTLSGKPSTDLSSPRTWPTA